MPFVEQLLFGADHRRNPSTRNILGMSAGIGSEVASEVERLCRGWGDTPALGLQQPALLSMPLSGTMPSMRGRLYVLIRVSRSDEPLFHAVVVSERSYAAFQHNPYLLARTITFAEQWIPGTSPSRFEIDAKSEGYPEAMAPLAQDRGFIDEAVVQVLLRGRLVLPIEVPNSECDRALALMVACLPLPQRRDLRFGSFTTSESNSYTLCALETTGSTFAGWQRLLRATPSSGITPEIESYQAAIAQALVAQDMNGIARTSERHKLAADRAPESMMSKDNVTAMRKTSIAPEEPPARGTTAERHSARPMVAVAAVPLQSDPRRSETGSGAVYSAAVVVAGNVPRGASRRPPSDHAARPRNPRRYDPRRTVSGRTGFLRLMAIVFVLFLVGWVVTMVADGRNMAQSLEWAGIPGMSRSWSETGKAATLLQVVDTGRVYDEQRDSLAKAGSGIKPSYEQARRKALANLTAQAAAPLVAQIDLFVGLSSEGIQQSGRQDRETERLRSLARQGEVLANEVARLELAWHSLAAGAMWTDLSELRDEQIAARCDSLNRSDRNALEAARAGMGLKYKKKELAEARRNVEGMSGLLALFQATSWSPRWASDLQSAADMVSPTASPLTRAYRNSAYVLLRIKQAERAPDNRPLPFLATVADHTWPSSAIRGLLPDLRRAARAFAQGDVPNLVAGTLTLYASFADPERAVAQAAASPGFLTDLAANPACKFDAAVYRPFLDRIRYEAYALNRETNSGKRQASDEPRSRDYRRFHQSVVAGASAADWNSLADSLGTPFLAEWARQKAGVAASAAGARRGQRATEFAAIWEAAGKLRRQAAVGGDWTGAWRRTYGLANRFLGTAAASGDGSDGTAAVAELTAALDRPLPMGVSRGTVRLPAAALTQPSVAILEVSVSSSIDVRRSREFSVGPAAPAGSGWVGTVDVDWIVPLAPREALKCRVLAANGQVLWESIAPALADGGGPSVWARPWPADGGSLDLKTDSRYWTALDVPHPDAMY